MNERNSGNEVFHTKENLGYCHRRRTEVLLFRSTRYLPSPPINLLEVHSKNYFMLRHHILKRVVNTFFSRNYLRETVNVLFSTYHKTLPMMGITEIGV